MPSDPLRKAEEVRGAMREWVQEYSRRRTHLCVGEFTDEEGAQNAQFGLGGTCFLAAIEDREELPQHFHNFWKALNTGLSTPTGERTNPIRHLLKDVPRVPTKTMLLALGPETDIDPTEHIRTVYRKRGVDGLIKSVIDDPHQTGDPIVTAMANLMLRFGSRDTAFMTEIFNTLPELRRQLMQGGLSLMERLFVSTCLCVYTFAESIDKHRSILNELYSDDDIWHRAFSSNSPFLDHRYSDTPINRYLRIPTAFIIMCAIYVSIGEESMFFSFPPVCTMLDEIRLPFSAHIGRDKNKSSVYYLWYNYVAMHPGTFLRTPKQSATVVAVARLGYWRRDLTNLGLFVLLVCCLGSLSILWFSYKMYVDGLESQLDKFVGAVGTTVSAFLGLFQTRKR